MIINTIIPDYENRNAGLTYTLIENPIKYFYPVRYGYNKTALMYSLSFPDYKKPVTSSLGLEDFLGQRQDVIDAKIRMILKEIDQRRILKDDNLYRICLDQCTCKNMVHQLESLTWTRDGWTWKKRRSTWSRKKDRRSQAISVTSVLEERTERIHHREPGRDPKAGYLHEQTGGNTMNTVTQDDIGKLQKDPLSFAILMEDQQIEHVIVTFVSVLIRRNENRGGQN